MLRHLPALLRQILPPRSTAVRGFARLAAFGPRILPFTIVAMAALLLLKLAALSLLWLPEGATRAIAQQAATWFAPAHAAEGAKPEAAKPEAAKPEAAKAEAAKAEPAKPEANKAESGETPGAVAPGATSGSAARPIGEVAAALGPGLSESERGLLTDLRTRRQELDKREAALAERANVLTAAEGRLAARLDEMKALQARLEASEKARQVATDANWRGLVKVYEDMRPRDAAAICNDLETDVLISVLDRMKDAKTATLLAAMDPVKAREATTLLAKRRALMTALPPAAPTPPVPVPAAAPPAQPVATPPGQPAARPAATPPPAPPAPAGATPPAPGKGADAAPPMRRTSL
jgi:flagellar motility protein MotE (MotC chaperone)